MKNPDELLNHQIKLGSGKEYIILDGGIIDNQYYYLAVAIAEPIEVKLLVRKEEVDGSIYVSEYNGNDYDRKLQILVMVNKIASEQKKE